MGVCCTLNRFFDELYGFVQDNKKHRCVSISSLALSGKFCSGSTFIKYQIKWRVEIECRVLCFQSSDTVSLSMIFIRAYVRICLLSIHVYILCGVINSYNIWMYRVLQYRKGNTRQKKKLSVFREKWEDYTQDLLNMSANAVEFLYSIIIYLWTVNKAINKTA